jgi:hypothetical protein
MRRVVGAEAASQPGVVSCWLAPLLGVTNHSTVTDCPPAVIAVTVVPRPLRQPHLLPVGVCQLGAERMFIGGIEMVARSEGSSGGAGSAAAGPAEKWRRVRVAPGVELHPRENLAKPKPGELKDLLARLETALRQGS